MHCVLRNDVYRGPSLMLGCPDSTIVAIGSTAVILTHNNRDGVMQFSKLIQASFGHQRVAGGACVGLLMLPAAGSWAAPDTAGVEEIVVTASKRGEETIQNTPFAVQAISGQQLADLGALQIGDYAALIPGFSFQDNGPGDKRYAIRGVSSTGAGTVGVYLDDVVITGENSQDGGGQQPDEAVKRKPRPVLIE